jgi:NAD(P)-dependent dehydrogenase (short-subunit alcohol dehydrogenase family)
LAADEITKATRARFGCIDILVNNAEIGPGSDHGAARAQLS